MSTALDIDPDVVWRSTRYDSGQYQCTVKRNGDGGTLTVKLLGRFVDHILHEEPVKLDRTDVDKWKLRCAAVISNPDLRSRQQ